MATAVKIYTTCAHFVCTLRIYLLVCRWAKMVACRPAGLQQVLPQLSQRTLNHGRAATATPITIAKAPDEYKTGASTKKHQFKGRAGTGAQPVSTSSAREYCESVRAGARFSARESETESQRECDGTQKP